MTSATLRSVFARSSQTNQVSKPQTRLIPTLILVGGAIYCLTPVLWVLIAATKSSGELFSTFTFSPGTGLAGNIQELFDYNSGQYLYWIANSALYSGIGGILSTLVSAMAGFALAKYTFRAHGAIFAAYMVGVLIPGITLAVPQYLLMSNMGLAGSRLSVLLPVIISPFGIYLSYVFAKAAVPTEIMEAARIDGSSELRIFSAMALPLMVPGMVTVFLLTFVGIWNNFLLPYIMLSDQDLYPLTVGLYTLLAKGSGSPQLYTLAITGAAIAVIPLIALVMLLQKYWRLDLVSGGIKG